MEDASDDRAGHRRRLRTMVVDDNPTCLKIITTMLAALHFVGTHSMCADDDHSILCESLRHGACFHFTKPMTPAVIEVMRRKAMRDLSQPGFAEGKGVSAGKRKLGLTFYGVVGPRRSIQMADELCYIEISSGDESGKGRTTTGGAQGSCSKKQRMGRLLWDSDLHRRFLTSVELLGKLLANAETSETPREGKEEAEPAERANAQAVAAAKPIDVSEEARQDEVFSTLTQAAVAASVTQAFFSYQDPASSESYIMASEISDCVFDHEDLPAAAGLQHDKLQDYFDNSLVIERALRKAFNVSSDEGDSSPPDAYMSLAEFVGLDQARGAVEKDVTKDNSCVPDERSRSPTQEHAPQQSGLLRRSSSVLSAKT
ncbi:hypothetical protein BHE74_00042120 [Ensete ventricosum]|nr:hypothetical protein BHE74_00042120 [Ensete ventricosum]